MNHVKAFPLKFEKVIGMRRMKNLPSLEEINISPIIIAGKFQIIEPYFIFSRFGIHVPRHQTIFYRFLSFFAAYAPSFQVCSVLHLIP